MPKISYFYFDCLSVQGSYILATVDIQSLTSYFVLSLILSFTYSLPLANYLSTLNFLSLWLIQLSSISHTLLFNSRDVLFLLWLGCEILFLTYSFTIFIWCSFKRCWSFIIVDQFVFSYLNFYSFFLQCSASVFNLLGLQLFALLWVSFTVDIIRISFCRLNFLFPFL